MMKFETVNFGPCPTV